jgi:tetratricopeptide (TPR) repeat protein
MKYSVFLSHFTYFLIFLLFVQLISCDEKPIACESDWQRLLETADSIRFAEPARADSLYRIVLDNHPGVEDAYHLNALIGMAKAKADQGQFDSASLIVAQLDEKVGSITDTTTVMEYFLAKGYLLTGIDNTDEAEKCYKQGLQLAIEQQNEDYQHIFRINMGQIHIERGQYTHALDILTDELQYAEKLNDMEHMALALMNMAEVRFISKDYPKALKAAKKALHLFSDLNMRSEANSLMMNMGIYYRNLGKPDSALIMYKNTYSEMLSTGDSAGLVKVRYNVANILKLQQKFDEAEKEMNHVFNYCNRNKIVFGKIYALSGLANIYDESGRSGESRVVIDSAIRMAEQAGMVNNLVTLYDQQRVICEHAGRFEEAYQSLLKYRNLSDSLLPIEKHNEILAIETRYETHQKEAENQLLKKDIEVKNSRIWLIGSVSATAVLAFIVVIGVFMMRHRKISYQRHLTAERNKVLESENKEKRIELEKKELENRLSHEYIEKLKMQSKLQEQELVFQTLVRVELTNLLRAVREKLSPFQLLFTRKRDQADFQQVITEITRDSKKDPLSEFEQLFRHLHPGFYEKLLEMSPTLSKTELLISAMIRLNLASKDIVNLINLSLATIESTRSHIRKKLNLESKENLTTFLMSI